MLAVDLLWEIVGFCYIDHKQYNSYQNLDHKKQRKIETAYGMLLPMHPKSSRWIKRELQTRGCYLLVDMDDRSAYVGSSQNIRPRLRQHPNKYQLYSYHKCSKEREMQDLEMASYHLVEEEKRERKASASIR